jgi:hypothetical protein
MTEVIVLSDAKNANKFFILNSVCSTNRKGADIQGYLTDFWYTKCKVIWPISRIYRVLGLHLGAKNHVQIHRI